MVAIDDRPGRTGLTAAPSAVAGGKLALPVKLYLLFLILPVAFTLGPLHMTLMRGLLLVMVVPLFFQLMSGRFGRLHLVDFAFCAHLIWIGVALAVNNPNRVVETFGSTGLEFLGGYLIARAYIRDRASFIALCKWLGVIALILLPLALYETQTGRPIVIETIRSIPGLLTEVNVNNPKRLNMERAQVVFAHPIHFGLFASVCFSLVAVGLKDILPTNQRFILAGAGAICCFTALSSGAILALILQCALIAWYLVFRDYPARWKLLFWLFVAAYVIVDLLSDRTPVRVFMSYATFSPHNAYWRGIIFEWGVMNILGNAERGIPPAPIFGIGMHNWVRPHFMPSGSMDNFWLVMGLRYGLPGFGFLALGYGVTLWQIGRRTGFSNDTVFLQLRRAWMFTFVGLTFTLCTVHVWTTVYSFTFFVFAAGLWMITALPETGDGAGPETEANTPPGQRYSRFAPRMDDAATPDAAPRRRDDRAPGAELPLRRAPGPLP